MLWAQRSFQNHQTFHDRCPEKIGPLPKKSDHWFTRTCPVNIGPAPTCLPCSLDPEATRHRLWCVVLAMQHTAHCRPTGHDPEVPSHAPCGDELLSLSHNCATDATLKWRQKSFKKFWLLKNIRITHIHQSSPKEKPTQITASPSQHSRPQQFNIVVMHSF